MNLHFLYSSLPLTLVLNTWAVCGQVMDESSTRPAGFVSQPAEPDRPHHERSKLFRYKQHTLCSSNHHHKHNDLLFLTYLKTFITVWPSLFYSIQTHCNQTEAGRNNSLVPCLRNECQHSLLLLETGNMTKIQHDAVGPDVFTQLCMLHVGRNVRPLCSPFFAFIQYIVQVLLVDKQFATGNSCFLLTARFC